MSSQQPRKSSRKNKGVLPKHFEDFEMSSNNGDGGNSSQSEDDHNETIRENETENILEAFKALKLEMKTMQTNLKKEREERVKLEGLLAQKNQDLLLQSSIGEINQTSSSTQSAVLTSQPTDVFYNNPPQQQQSSETGLPHSSGDSHTIKPPSTLQVNAPPFQPTASPINAMDSQILSYLSSLTGATKKLRELPIYSGSAEAWPAFKISYNEGNVQMRYSNWDNFQRLQKALVGLAKDAVSGLMIHPDNVDLVMIELERQFGQKQHLLKSQLKKAYEITPVPENHLELLIPFATKVRNLASFLETIDSEPHLANPNLIEELVKKLPPSKRSDWGRHAMKIVPYATVRHFSDWLSEEAYVISYISPTSLVEPHQPKRRSREVLHATAVTKSTPTVTCRLCKKSHRLIDCGDFQKKNVKERWSFVKNNRLCFACLRYGHQTFECRSKKTCIVEGCKKPHHELLHEDDPPESSDDKESSKKMSAHVSVNCANNVIGTQDGEVLFKIVPIRLYGPNERSLDTFAMIDEGSSVTLIDDSILSTLQLQGKPEQLTLQWFGNKTSSVVSQLIDLEISGIGSNDPKYKMNGVRSVKNIDLPLQTLKLTELHNSYRMIKKLPIAQYENARPMVLIGLNHSFLGAPMKAFVEKNWTGPVVVKTKLGWVVYGPYEAEDSRVNPRFHHIDISAIPREDENLEKKIDDYFSIENFGIQAGKLESESDKVANILLESTTSKVGDRFQTGLLWKDPNVILPNSYGMAKKRFLSIERKFKGDPAFKSIYTAMVQNNIDKKYARKLSVEEAAVTTNKTWYLPHFATSNPNKPGKYRLVYDAAAKVNGLCLNDHLMKGPDLYNSLGNVLINFRMKSVAVSGDIEEMFSQVLIKPSDRQAQRFLWRYDESEPLGEYVMDVMTFGVTCSPASAHYVKNTNALSFVKSHPEAVNSIISHHYVDDFADSFDNAEDAMRIASEVKMIHHNAGFNLRRFVSNRKDVSNLLNGYETQQSVKKLDLDATSNERILGMVWDTKDDCFKFDLKFSRVSKDVVNGTRSPTKRELVSFIMSVFDPFGFLADLMVHSKIIMQQLWRLNVGWDEPIPSVINSKWMQWREELAKVKDFTVPRHYFTGFSSVIDIQIHTFVDASQDAFSAATYIRITDGNNIAVRFVMGKSRCSPIKKLLSIPRLELQSAVLGTRLCATVMESNKFQASKRFFWSDSATVISWIRSDLRRYKPFVAHRISEIIDSTDPYEWHWISTKLNVADKATRATFPINYEPDSQWKNGPAFLYTNEHEWPVNNLNDSSPTNEEVRPKCLNIAKQVVQIVDISKYSSLLTVQRIVAWICRFINVKFNRQNNCLKGELIPMELQHAEVLLCKMVQKAVFQDELSELRQGKNVSRSSHIHKLTPVLDDDGVIRLSGRLRRSLVVTESAKQPIILPKDHVFTKLVVLYYHQKMKHQNVKTIVNEIQQKFWVPNLKSAVNKGKRECLICRHRLAKPVDPLMGELPFDRINAYIRPFTYTGLDYFGPYHVTIGRRTEKRWVALFTCMTIRAVHLELAENLTTDSCLLCIRNFVNRRGVPIRIRSDNGTNFIGASKEIQEAINNLDHDRITAELSTNNIEWKFNCPENPHAGGSWERLVQSVKKVLSYTLHEESPKVETLRSLLIEAECIVNNRPLTEIPLTHEDEEPLTPSHFLLGTINTTQTPGTDDGKIWCLRKQWRVSQQLKNRFWKKWSEDYLPTLLRRSKWYTKVNPIKVGDVVLICDRDILKNQFQKGLVLEVYPGADGQVRTAKVKTSTGTLKRPATKLAVLDIDDGESARSCQPGAFTGGGVVAASKVTHPTT